MEAPIVREAPELPEVLEDRLGVGEVLVRHADPLGRAEDEVVLVSHGLDVAGRHHLHVLHLPLRQRRLKIREAETSEGNLSPPRHERDQFVMPPAVLSKLQTLPVPSPWDAVPANELVEDVIARLTPTDFL